MPVFRDSAFLCSLQTYVFDVSFVVFASMPSKVMGDMSGVFDHTILMSIAVPEHNVEYPCSSGPLSDEFSTELEFSSSSSIDAKVVRLILPSMLGSDMKSILDFLSLLLLPFIWSI